MRQIQHEVRRARSLDDLHFYFNRVQALRRAHPDEFEFQLNVAEVQDEILGRGRLLRSEARDNDSTSGSTPISRRREAEEAGEEEPAEEERAPQGQELDPKTWQRATYLALFFTLILFFAFFYLVQTARRINFPQQAATPEASGSANTSKQPEGKPTSTEEAKKDDSTTPPAGPVGPLLRLYTDLIPATLVFDDKPAQDLTDGELNMDKLEPGRHTLKITGKNGSAAINFDVTQGSAPRVVGQPSATNVMAVAVSTDNGKGRLITNAEHPTVLLDGNALAQSDTEGAVLETIGQNDHDLQVTEGKDRQRFVLTYLPAPALTLYVKSDPNAGTVVVSTGQDEADVFINDKLYRRRTEHGQVRIPLKVGDYTIRVHKAGFIDPAPQTVQVKKAEESPLEFKFDPAPQLATLQVRDSTPGTMVYIDKDVAAMIGPDGLANITNVKPGAHTIELRRDQAVPKKFDRTFTVGETVVLSGPEAKLDRAVSENKPAAPTPEAAPATPPSAAPAPAPMAIDGQQVRKGGGFVPYHVPRGPGHYSFQAQSRKGGLFKRGKVQWYAGYQDAENYILYTLDGKRATVKEVRGGKTTELGKATVEYEDDEWLQVDMSVRAGSVVTRVKPQNGSWTELPTVTVSGRDLTQDKVGMYIPGNDELAVANFRFSNR